MANKTVESKKGKNVSMHKFKTSTGRTKYVVSVNWAGINIDVRRQIRTNLVNCGMSAIANSNRAFFSNRQGAEKAFIHLTMALSA